MITVAQAVHALVMRSPLLSEGLSRGLLNVSAVAREFQDEVSRRTGKPVTIGSIVMALKRLPLAAPRPDTDPLAAGTEMIQREGLFETTYASSPTLFRCLRQLMEIVGDTRHFLTVTTGLLETTIVASQSLRPAISSMFDAEREVFTIEGLSAITIQLPTSILATPGAYAQLLKLLAWEGINIVEVVSTYRELTILLRREEVDRGWTLLKRALQ